MHGQRDQNEWWPRHATEERGKHVIYALRIHWMRCTTKAIKNEQHIEIDRVLDAHRTLLVVQWFIRGNGVEIFATVTWEAELMENVEYWLRYVKFIKFLKVSLPKVFYLVRPFISPLYKTHKRCYDSYASCVIRVFLNNVSVTCSFILVSILFCYFHTLHALSLVAFLWFIFSSYPALWSVCQHSKYM